MRKNKIILVFSFVFALTVFFPVLTANAEQAVLKQNMSGDNVLDLQKKLQQLGFYRGCLDGVFGTGTMNAVINFQSDYNLETDGIAGQETLRTLQSITSTVSSKPNDSSGALKQGMYGERVLNLQKKLKELGYYQGTLDSSFGTGTHNAVINFQSDNNLKVDGIAGLATLRTLFTPGIKGVSASRGQVGDRKSQMKGQTIVSYAKQFLGVKYAWSGNSPSGFDCSGFTYYVFGQHGIKLPRMASEQFNTGVKVSQLQLGDLVFYSTYQSGPSHVGIYIGNNQFIHSSSGAGHVTITPLSKPYYQQRYLGARRVL